MTSERPPRTSPVFFDDGRTRVYVDDGAVRQDGRLPLCRCNTCGHEVVWATSRRTGRRYLVNIFLGYNRRRFYVKRSVHRCEDYLSPDRAITLGIVPAPADPPPVAAHDEHDPFAAAERRPPTKDQP